MSDNQFDEFLKKKLQRYPSPVPEDMWQRIQEKKERDRKGFFFRWGLTGLLLIFLTGGYFISITGKKTGNQKAISSVDTQNTRARNKPGKVRAKAKDDVKIKEPTKGAGSTGQLDNDQKNLHSIAARKKEEGTHQYFTPTANSARFPKQKKPAVKNTGVFRQVSTPANIGIHIASDSSSSNDSVEVAGSTKSADSIINANPKLLNPTPLDSSLKNKKQPLEKELKKESRLLSRQNKWVIDFYISPDVPFDEIVSGNPNYTDYLKKRYKMQVSYTAGVRVARPLAKHFSIKAGLQYSQINVQFSDSNTQKTPNRYKSIDIPFLIGYDMEKVDFTTTVNAGIILNAACWYKGTIVDSNAVTSINTANIYKHNTGISLYIACSFAKKLNDKMLLFAEPYFRYRLSYMTRSREPYSQKIHVAGALFGLKYIFQKSRQHK